ncbi:MAG: ATPase, partial [Rhodobacteraceae bacterium]
DKVDPDDFVRWTYAQALAHRQPRYAAMAANWGVKIRAEDLYLVRNGKDFTSLIADTLPV